jgi:ferrochelatase
MAFRREPEYQHGSVARTAVLLVNLGTPAAPTTAAVRTYLREFLWDPRVVEIPRLLWWPILNGVILPFRANASARRYASIWTEHGSPLLFHSQQQALLLRGYLGERGVDVDVALAMRYGAPSIPDALARLQAANVRRVLVVPMYPQYSGTTTASVFDAVGAEVAHTRNLPELRWVRSFADHPGYIDALRRSVLDHWKKHGRAQDAGGKLVVSFHGVPRRTLQLGDPYHCECQKTARLLTHALGLSRDEVLVTFQSRFGRAEWLQPYTADVLRDLGRAGARRVDVMCPGFVADCLETLEEIVLEGRQEFQAAGGGELSYVPCLNEAPAFIHALADLATTHLGGWPVRSEERARLESEARAGRAAALEMGAGS